VFGGQVEIGTEYIGIDDVAGSGGTFGELNKFLADNGGKLVGLFAIAQGYMGSNIVLSHETLAKLIQVFDFDIIALSKELKERGLYEGKIQFLSEGEARTFLEDVYEKRNQRTASGEQKNNRLLRQKSRSVQRRTDSEVSGGVQREGITETGLDKARQLASEILYETQPKYRLENQSTQLADQAKFILQQLTGDETKKNQSIPSKDLWQYCGTQPQY
jgi:hypothetical protein